MQSIESHIHEVISGLEDDQQALVTCLSGLKSSQDGQLKLSTGKSHDALPLLSEARTSFQKIPAARYMLAITNADIAAAHANLGNFSEAGSFANEAISTLQGQATFAETEANAHMTLANSLAMSGSHSEADNHYDKAKELYQRLSNGSHYLRALEHNRAAAIGRISAGKKPWWKFW